MIGAVIDTSVYVAALVFGGKPAAVLQLAESGAFQVVVSPAIKSELTGTLVGLVGCAGVRTGPAAHGHDSHLGYPGGDSQAGQ